MNEETFRSKVIEMMTELDDKITIEEVSSWLTEMAGELKEGAMSFTMASFFSKEQ